MTKGGVTLNEDERALGAAIKKAKGIGAAGRTRTFDQRVAVYSGMGLNSFSLNFVLSPLLYH